MKFVFILFLSASCFGFPGAGLTDLPTVSKAGGLRKGLVSYWAFEEASGTRNDSFGANNLTANGTPGQGTGMVGNDVTMLAASAQFLSINNNSTLQAPDQDFALCGWVFLTDKSTLRIAFCKGNSSGAQGEYELIYNSGTDRFRFTIGDGAAQATVDANSLGSPTLSTWYFLTGWRVKSANTINIQVDNLGVDSTTTTRIPLIGTLGLQIGNDQGTTRYWNGSLDEFALRIGSIWERGERSDIRAMGVGGKGLANWR